MVACPRCCATNAITQNGLTCTHRSVICALQDIVGLLEFSFVDANVPERLGFAQWERRRASPRCAKSVFALPFCGAVEALSFCALEVHQLRCFGGSGNGRCFDLKWALSDHTLLFVAFLLILLLRSSAFLSFRLPLLFLLPLLLLRQPRFPSAKNPLVQLYGVLVTTRRRKGRILSCTQKTTVLIIISVYCFLQTNHRPRKYS